MKQELEFQPQLCSTGTTERANLAQAGLFLWVPKRSLPSLVSPIKDHWLTEIPHLTITWNTLPRITHSLTKRSIKNGIL